MKAMKAAEKFFKILDKITYALAAVCVGGMLVCVFLQVVARICQFSINWTTEMSQYFFLWSTTFASYIAARRGKLLGVEIVRKMFPVPVQRVLKFISWGAGAAFYILVDYYCALQLPKLMPQTTPVLKWSMGLIYIIMMVGLGLLSIYFIYLAIISLFGKDEKPKAAKTADQIAEEVE